MSIPLLNFSLIWRGTKCPRQLKVWFDTSTQHNPKLSNVKELRDASLELNRFFRPEQPGEADTEILDAAFQAWQEEKVRILAASLFPQARDVEAESWWHLEGESLREIGWIQSMSPPQNRAQDLNKDNWDRQLASMSGIRNSGMVNHFICVTADYLFRDEEGHWLLVLIKPGVRVKDSYIAEAELIKWAYGQKGIVIKRAYLLSPRDDYELPLSSAMQDAIVIDPRQYFRLHSLNAAVKHMVNPLSKQLPDILNRAAAGEPCDNPRNCSLCKQGIPTLPEHNIYTLHRGGKAVELLEAQGIIDLKDIDTANTAAKAELKDRHHIQLKTIRSGTAHIDRSGLQNFLTGIRFPICFLDFESTCEAIPPLVGTRPWEHLPFMFSLHRATNRDVLRNPPSMPSRMSIMDPLYTRQGQIRAFAENLLDACRDCGSILVYGAALESVTFTRLARCIPEYASAFISLRDRIIDLQTPFAQFWYYHPQQYGKLSLKKILPLMSDHNHDRLDLQSGGEVNLNYYFLSNPEAVPPGFSQSFGQDTVPNWLQSLERYCGLDTLGLAHILDTFFRLVE